MGVLRHVSDKALSHLPLVRDPEPVSKDSTKLHMDRTICPDLADLSSLVGSDGLAPFQGPAFARQTSPFSPLNQPIWTCESMMQTVGDLLSNDSRASHSSSSASPLLGRGKNKGSKSPFSLLSEPISPSSLLFDFLIQVHPVQFPLLPTFLFLPPPYFFPLFLPPPNLFWAISPSSLFCSPPPLFVNSSLESALNKPLLLV